MSRCANVRMVRISFKLSFRSQFLHFLKVMVNLIVLMITDHWSGGFCDPKSGACSCLAGWRGALCDDPCPPGTHGANCTSSCQVMDEMVLSLNIGMVVTMLLSLTVLTMVLQCQNQGNCHPVTGNCHCPMGWTVSFWYNWIETCTLSYCCMKAPSTNQCQPCCSKSKFWWKNLQHKKMRGRKGGEEGARLSWKFFQKTTDLEQQGFP